MYFAEVDNRLFVERIMSRLSQKREGIHLSDLEMCLKASYFRRVNPQPLSVEQAIMFATGLGTQEYMYPKEEVTYELDGILCSPDAHAIEVKTYRGNPKGFSPANMPHWIWRMKGYCKVLGVNTYTLDVAFIMSNTAKSYQFEFTQNEIDLMWEEALIRKDIFARALTSNTPPTPDFHPDWLCKKCEHVGSCFAL